MQLTTFSKPGSIYLAFYDIDAPVSVWRREAGQDYWRLIGTSRAGFYEDFTAVYGIAYEYHLSAEGYDDAYSLPVWCIDSKTNYGIIQDIFWGASYATPLLMGRIYSTNNGDLLDPQKVISVNYAIQLYLSNDIVCPPQTMTLATGNIDREKSITSNLILSPEWKADNVGYNFRLELPEPKCNPPYIVKTEIITTTGNLVFNWLISKSYQQHI